MQGMSALQAFGQYVKKNPSEVSRAVRSAFGLRFGLPIDALRWLAEKGAEGGGVDGLQIDPVPPGIRFGANVEQMGTKIRASAILYIERVKVTGEEMRIDLRVEQITLRLLEDADSPVAMLIKSGALDLSRPGNLVKHLPQLPAFVVEAHDDRIVLDLMRHPKLGRNETVRAAVSLLTAFVTVHSVETDEGHLDVSLRALPSGVFHAAKQVRQHLLRPGLRHARLLLPRLR